MPPFVAVYMFTVFFQYPAYSVAVFMCVFTYMSLELTRGQVKQDSTMNLLCERRVENSWRIRELLQQEEIEGQFPDEQDTS